MRLKRISYVISKFTGVSVVFAGYPVTLVTTDNTHKCCLGKGISPRKMLDPGVLFQGKKNAFLRNTANKHRVISII